MNNIKEAFRYILAGLINTAIGYGIFIFLVYIILIDAYYANAIGYFFGLCTAFILNKYFVFNVKNTTKIDIIKFLVSFLFSYGINIFTLFLCLNLFNLSAAMGQAIAMIFYTISFYIVNKYIVFYNK